MIIHSKVLGRDFSCDAKDAAETMKEVLALEAVAKAEEDDNDDDFLASALDDVLTELDKNYDEQDKLEAEIDELEAKIAEVESKLSAVYDRIEELEAEEAEIEVLMDDNGDCCEWDCDCDDCPDKEACYDEDDDEDEDVSESPYHCVAVIIKNGDEEKRVPADFSAVINAILEMLEDEEDDLDY